MSNPLLRFPPTEPMHCTLHNCKCVYQGNTDKFTIALYCENRQYALNEITKFCVYMYSCGRVIRGKIEVHPGETLKETVTKAVNHLFPQMINLAEGERPNVNQLN